MNIYVSQGPRNLYLGPCRFYPHAYHRRYDRTSKDVTLHHHRRASSERCCFYHVLPAVYSGLVSDKAWTIYVILEPRSCRNEIAICRKTETDTEVGMKYNDRNPRTNRKN